MNETYSKKREWIKNAAIIFLALMLLLTFFSNTIMNYSLPEVSTQYVQRGTITAKVRGTGNLEAVDPYNVIARESRVISSVAVKQGDEVEKDQVLYYLEETESDELKKAEAELDDLELSYMKGLFGGNVSPEIIAKVSSGNTDSFNSLKNKVTDMQDRMDAAQARIQECQENLNKISLQSTIQTNDATINTIPGEYEKAQAATDLENAQTAETNAQAAFNQRKAEKTAELQNIIKEKEKQIEDLKVLVDGAELIATDVTAAGTGGINTYIQQREGAEKAVQNALQAIYKAKNGETGTCPDLFDGKGNFKSSVGEAEIDPVRNKAEYSTLIADYYAAVTQWQLVCDMVNEMEGGLHNYGSNEEQLRVREAELKELQAQLNSLNAMVYTPGDDVEEAKKRLDEATRVLTELNNANKQTSVAYQNKIANAEAALKNAQSVYELLKEEQAKLTSDINAELDLSKTSKDIASKKEEIEKLKEKSMGGAILAPVAGKVTSLSLVAGESTKPEEAVAIIETSGKGYALSFPVTNEQASLIQVGDEADLQNAWYYEDVHAIVSAIRADAESKGQKKLVVFDVTGENLQAGQSLNLSVGQRSAEYEFTVPNVAVREDSNGKFILIVESKSGPISNRYIATRVDVQVLASDDNNTAISAPLYGYEYVITTASKPVEAGKQVRLANN